MHESSGYLTAQQIGKLAAHIEKAIKDHPDKGAKQRGKPPWEDDLMVALQYEPDLPSYTWFEQVEPELLDNLIGYFAIRN